MERSFWTNDEYMQKLQIVDWLVQSSETAKKFVLNEFGNFKEELNKVFYCFIQLTLFTTHKTFFEHRWADYKQDFIVMRQFFQNLNENNFQPFKKFFGSQVPKIWGVEFNPENLTYLEFYTKQIFGIIKTTDLLADDSTVIELHDRPEIFDILALLFDGLNEFVNGPCIENQISIFSKRMVSFTRVCLIFRSRNLRCCY